MDAAMAQAALARVDRVSIVTRQFDDQALGTEFACTTHALTEKVSIDRLAIAERRYLEKEALDAALPALTDAFCAHLAALPRLPDIIHAHFADAASLAEAARLRLGIPFVYTPHALGIDKKPLLRAGESLEARLAAERRAIAAANAIIVSTQDEADRQVAAYGVPDSAARVKTLPPGVPHNALRAGPTALPGKLAQWLDTPGKPIVLAIARPVRKKNLAALMRAFAAMPALADAANLVILAGQHGNGVRSAEEAAVIGELKSLCGDERLRGKVALPPDHSAADVHALYRMAADGGVFVNPALHEPFGLTLLEAAAMGVPVVATRHGGPVDIIGTIGHGILVDPRDDAAIGAACLRIVTDSALHARFSQAGRDNAGRFSWPRYAQHSVALYASLREAPRLLACDIDNTLTGCAEGARAFTHWRTHSRLPFVVATGRSFGAARRVLAEWGLPQPDAFIVDVGTRLILPDTGGWRACTDYAGAIARDWDRDAVLAALADLPLMPQPSHTDGPHKISFYGTAEDAAAIRSTLQEAALPARVIFSHGRLIDVLAPHAGKAAAVAAYASRLGLSLTACVAAGDSGNDIDMLAACGRAIVVGNASAELAACAPHRGTLHAKGHHAAGVMEGLAAFGLVATLQEPRGA
jgi:sucrose-phosphate synthase